MVVLDVYGARGGVSITTPEQGGGVGCYRVIIGYVRLGAVSGSYFIRPVGTEKE